MALPNPGMDAVPFTPLTAEFLDDIIENIESLSSGTGIDDGSITADKLDWPTHIDWSTSAVVTGWSSTTVKAFQYQRIGNIVFFYTRVEGASNSATTTMSLPVPAAVLTTMTAMVLNNGNWGSGAAVIDSSTVTILTAVFGNLSATGAKGFRISGFYFV